jgi:Fic/DOC family
MYLKFVKKVEVFFVLLLCTAGFSSHTCEENLVNYIAPNYAAGFIHPGVFIPRFDEEVAGDTFQRYVALHQPELTGKPLEDAFSRIDVSAYTTFLSKTHFVFLDLGIENVVSHYHPGELLSGQKGFSLIESILAKGIGSFSAPALEKLIIKLQAAAVHFETLRDEEVVGYRGESMAAVSTKYPCTIDELLECIGEREPGKLKVAKKYLDKFSKSKSRGPEAVLSMKLTKEEQAFQDEFLYISPYRNPKKPFIAFVNELVERIRRGEDWIELAAFAHTAVVRIHPFLEGNGRTARFLMNTLLMSGGYGPVVFLSEGEYAESIRNVGPNFKAIAFEKLLKRKLEAMQDPRISGYYQRLAELVASDNEQPSVSSRRELEKHLRLMLKEKM